MNKVIAISGDISNIVGQTILSKLEGKKILVNFDMFINKMYNIDADLSQSDRDILLTEITNLRNKMLIDLVYTYINIHYKDFDWVVVTNVSRKDIIKQFKTKLSAYLISAKSLPTSLAGYKTKICTWMDQIDFWDYIMEETEKSGLILPDVDNIIKGVKSFDGFKN